MAKKALSLICVTCRYSLPSACGAHLSIRGPGVLCGAHVQEALATPGAAVLQRMDVSVSTRYLYLAFPPKSLTS